MTRILCTILALTTAACFSVEPPDAPSPPAEPTTTAPTPAPTPGSDGVQGTDGTPGTVTRADTYTVIGTWMKFGPGEVQSSIAVCASAADVLLTGGCMLAANNGEASITTSSPLVPERADEPAYWTCMARNTGTDPAEIVATAVCARGK